MSISKERRPSPEARRCSVWRRGVKAFSRRKWAAPLCCQEAPEALAVVPVVAAVGSHQVAPPSQKWWELITVKTSNFSKRSRRKVIWLPADTWAAALTCRVVGGACWDPAPAKLKWCSACCRAGNPCNPFRWWGPPVTWGACSVPGRLHSGKTEQLGDDTRNPAATIHTCVTRPYLVGLCGGGLIVWVSRSGSGRGLTSGRGRLPVGAGRRVHVSIHHVWICKSWST